MLIYLNLIYSIPNYPFLTLTLSEVSFGMDRICWMCGHRGQNIDLLYM